MYGVLVGEIFTRHLDGIYVDTGYRCASYLQGVILFTGFWGELYLQGICVFHIYMVYACLIFTGYQSWSYYIQFQCASYIQGVIVYHIIYRV